MSNETSNAKPRTASDPQPEGQPNQAPPPKTGHPFPAADAFAGVFSTNLFASWTASQQAFQRAIGDAQERAQSFAEHYAVMESRLLAHAQGAVTSWAQLTQDAIAYAAQLATEARKVGLEAARKVGAGA
ncbi:MAG: hypothetical protein M3680_18820 [Myxococcota bacterium]|nr:hypothetical protein [Myxococcota bacterium]